MRKHFDKSHFPWTIIDKLLSFGYGKNVIKHNLEIPNVTKHVR